MAKKLLVSSRSKNSFIDSVRIYVHGGNGGNGCVSFRREKYVPRGGPNGGDGGKGGDVIITTNPYLWSLFDFKLKTHFYAQKGSHGQGKNKTGHSGKDLIISVPVGTEVYDAVSNELIVDLIEVPQQICVAKGGRGGRGNAHFATATHQIPTYAEEGELGEEKFLRLELKLLANVAIIGGPNAGKSTLLAHISQAHPKIADYPFTTISPNLGVCFTSKRRFVAADIPGLIEGAHQGKGLGDKFLKHIERSQLLLHIIDGSTENPYHDFCIINNELSNYSEKLKIKPQIVVINKIDLVDSLRIEEILMEFRREGVIPLSISALYNKGILELIDEIDTELLQKSKCQNRVHVTLQRHLLILANNLSVTKGKKEKGKK